MMMAELDDQTESLVQQLYDAWSTNAKPTCYIGLRDQLLSRRERVDTCIATLKTVIAVACPQINESERYFDPKWEELFTLAESIESSAGDEDGTLGKRKRGYNEVHRLRNLAVVSALWSPDVVRHYGWNSAAQGCMRLLKTCALRFPDFRRQFCPHLNRVLLDRHREAIVSGHLKNLNEAPFQGYRDLNIVVSGGVVPDLETEELWVASSNGAVPVDSDGRLLKDVRPYHVHQHLLRRDRYGMLVARGECQDIPAITHQQSDFPHASSLYGEFMPHDNGQLASVPELTFSPMFTTSGVDTLLDSLAFSYQADPLLYGLHNTPTITLSSNNTIDLASNQDEVPIPDNTFNLVMPEQYYADNDKISNTRTGTMANSRGKSQKQVVTSLPQTKRLAQLPASPTHSRVRTGTLSSQPGETPTIENKLHDKYNEMLSEYVKRLSDEVLPGYEQRRVRSHWLSSDTKWARIWSTSGPETMPPGTATSKADCDVLYCSVDGMLEAARSGEIFLKPVIVKESFSDAGMHSYERFLELLEDASSSDEQVAVRCIDVEKPMHHALGRFTAYLRTHTERTDGLWMSTARSVANCHRPLFTMLNRFRLLDSVTAGLHNHRSNSSASPLRKATSVNSNIIAFPGAFSGAYINTAAGSWQRNLSGVKLWLFVPENEMGPGELASLTNEDSGWLPQGKERLVVLEENDVLFVPPGLRLMQAWHTPTTCLTEQGVLWDDLSILSILESMSLDHEHHTVQDAGASQQLLRMMNNLDCLIREQPDRFRRSMAQDEFLARFREASQSWLVPCSDGGKSSCFCSIPHL